MAGVWGTGTPAVPAGLGVGVALGVCADRLIVVDVVGLGVGVAVGVEVAACPLRRLRVS